MRQSWLVFLFASAVSSICASASTIVITPASQVVEPGQSFTADVTAVGFSGGSAPAIGAYGLTISFDPSVVTYEGIKFGTSLDLTGLGDVQSVTPSIGALELFELSLDSTNDLNALQPDTFLLAQIAFTTIDRGTSPLDLSSSGISDASGNALYPTFANGTVVVGQGAATTATPEPNCLALCLTGLITFALRKVAA